MCWTHCFGLLQSHVIGEENTLESYRTFCCHSPTSVSFFQLKQFFQLSLHDIFTSHVDPYLGVSHVSIHSVFGARHEWETILHILRKCVKVWIIFVNITIHCSVVLNVKIQPESESIWESSMRIQFQRLSYARFFLWNKWLF